MGLQLQSSLDESTGCSVVLDPENGVESEPRKLPSSKFKGVVPQPNGRWGAQIYEKHQRVWLGTFNHEDAAARAYDVAVRRFRGRDAVTNLKNNEPSEDELVFINSHSKSEIVDMLRKHTYDEELQQMSKRRSSFCLDVRSTETESSNGDVTEGASRSGAEPLFEKAVTPSDVGKLNRLVIPKNQAEKHFPLPLSNVSNTKGVLLNFEDVTGKVWRFRYSYWNSSQSYVLTKGWSRFVKEKNLKAGDTVCFSRSNGAEKQMYIDWRPKSSTGSDPNPVQVVRLFGVNILTKDVNDVVTLTCGAKRMTEVDMVAFDCRKKQRLVVVDAL